jgi:hypothetical protein
MLMVASIGEQQAKIAGSTQVAQEAASSEHIAAARLGHTAG